MNYKIGLSLTFSFLVFSGVAYGLYRLTLLPYGYAICIFAASFQLVLLITVLMEIDHLADFHLDRWTLIITVLFGSILRKRTDVPFEILFQIIQWLSSLAILAVLIRYRKKIPSTKVNWSLGGALAGLVMAVIQAYLVSFYEPVYLETSPYPVGSIVYILAKTFQQLTYITPIEEIVFRGLLWGYLIRGGWSEKKVFWVQAILFWLMHIPQVFITPIPLLGVVPITILVISLFVLFSKQIFPAIAAHTLLNVFQPIIGYLVVHPVSSGHIWA